MLNTQVLERFPPSERRTTSAIIQWVPPIPNWNPWIASNIDEGPLATATMETISMELRRAQLSKNIEQLNIRLGERSKLPVTNYREEILKQIQGNKVILIRGATGCGKTTQVIPLQSNDFLDDDCCLRRFLNSFLIMLLNKIKVLFVILLLHNHVESVLFQLLNVLLGVSLELV